MTMPYIGAGATDGIVPEKASYYMIYQEGLYVGYRYYETRYEDYVQGTGHAGAYDYQDTVAFPFGHGLSYTKFQYGEATCRKSGNGYKVSIDVTNVGDREGKEVVQMYIGDDECTLARPVKELKGFKKVTVKPGQTIKVTFDITQDMLKFYDPAQKGWVLEKGSFTAYVGSASDDIRSSVSFVL